MSTAVTGPLVELAGNTTTAVKDSTNSVKGLLKSQSRKESNKIFHELDTDNDNSLDHENIAKFVESNDRLWAMLSVNLDQSEKNCQKVATMVAMEVASGLQGEQAMQAQISKGQFHMFRKRCILDPQGSQHFFHRAVFAFFDTDNNSLLDEQELDHFLATFYKTGSIFLGDARLPPKEELKRLILEKFDTNGDGKLTFEMMRRIISGEATDAVVPDSQKAEESIEPTDDSTEEGSLDRANQGDVPVEKETTEESKDEESVTSSGSNVTDDGDGEDSDSDSSPSASDYESSSAGSDSSSVPSPPPTPPPPPPMEDEEYMRVEPKPTQGETPTGIDCKVPSEIVAAVQDEDRPRMETEVQTDKTAEEMQQLDTDTEASEHKVGGEELAEPTRLDSKDEGAQMDGEDNGVEREDVAISTEGSKEEAGVEGSVEVEAEVATGKIDEEELVEAETTEQSAKEEDDGPAAVSAKAAGEAEESSNATEKVEEDVNTGNTAIEQAPKDDKVVWDVQAAAGKSAQEHTTGENAEEEAAKNTENDQQSTENKATMFLVKDTKEVEEADANAATVNEQTPRKGPESTDAAEDAEETETGTKPKEETDQNAEEEVMSGVAALEEQSGSDDQAEAIASAEAKQAAEKAAKKAEVEATLKAEEDGLLARIKAAKRAEADRIAAKAKRGVFGLLVRMVVPPKPKPRHHAPYAYGQNQLVPKESSCIIL